MSEALQIPASTLEQQFAASSPKNSSWVSANAGSGKTHVLTQRVIRLMLAGNSPDRILCLTFTKAAAANMKNRVFETLAHWTMMASDELDDAIYKSSGERANDRLRIRARQLFARALDTPGGLKIQTIHAFCESLLHQFPLEANVPGHFETLQDLEQVNMLAAARSHVLGGGGPGGAQHYEALVPYASDKAIEDGITAIVGMRQKFLKWISVDVETAIHPLYAEFGLEREDTEQSIKQRVLDTLLIQPEVLKEITYTASTSDKVTDLNLAKRLEQFLNGVDINARFGGLATACLTAKMELRKESGLATKYVKEIHPDAVDHLQSCGMQIIAGLGKIKALQLLQNSFHLFKIGEAVLDRYAKMKRARGAVDFDDLIERCANLLNRSDIRDWIRYRLDHGVDHILVDEAQDTSPTQWEIINAITSDFHVGENASHIERTVFVVGDEKQSIYSFQGASPSEFGQQEKSLRKRVESAGGSFHPGRLELSFRSTRDVLHAVDRVFENEENAHGLTQSGEPSVHDAVRANDPGEVQVWPLFGKDDDTKTESWLDPVDRQGSDDPAARLAERIADTIADWVGKPLPGTGEPLKFGDILVLVRKRDRFLTALTRTMKDKGLEIAGADRLKLTDHIAVEDLLALGRVALMPEDDLSLACVLKGVFFNLDEEALFDLAYGRKDQSLYERINKTTPDISGTLERIISLGNTSNVFEFYARVLGEMGARGKMLARFGMEAEDVLDAFLEEALAYSHERNGGLETFIAELAKAEPEIKREVELDRDEVRILTIHSSKGLEAKVVFLVDPCGSAWSEKFRPPVMNISKDESIPEFIWMTGSDQHIEKTRESVEGISAAAEAEYRRLLYVGMTRAADRLVVCGYHGKRTPEHPHWHKMVHEALVDTSTEMLDESGEVKGWRWVKEERPPVALKTTSLNSKSTDDPLDAPNWLFEPAKSDPPLPRPLTPSGAHALIDPESPGSEALEFSNDFRNNAFALQKGNATHKLLEVLPDIATEERVQKAERYLQGIGQNWEASQRSQVLSAVMAVLDLEVFANSDEQTSRAEVSLAGRLDTKSGPMLVTGQIDRLIINADNIIVLDYKTNRTVPDEAEDVSTEYITQLALYRALVSQIYPDKPVISKLLWTQIPKLMEIPEKMLDNVIAMIKNG